MTTSISSLPPELLLRILELTTEDERLAPYFVQSSHDRLRLFSLVARAWKAPAQTLLWRRVVLKDRRLVERWLECPVLGEHRTMELSIQRSHHERLRFLELRVRQQGSSDWARLDAVVNFTEVLDAALGAVRGLEVLRLAGCELGLRSLGLPNLADLKHLELQYPQLIDFPDSFDEPQLVQLPFRLSSLVLVSWAASLPPSFFHSIFLSSSNSLATIKLDGRAPISLDNFLPHFHLVAGSLTTLLLTSPWAHLIPHLRLCTSLTHLSLLQSTSQSTHALSIFRILPNSLHTLSLEEQTLHEKIEILRVLLEYLEWPALKGLKALVLGRDGHDALALLEKEAGGSSALERRGVRIVYPFEA